MKKFTTLALALAFAFTGTVANGATIEELQAQIDALLAQLAGVTTTTTSTGSYTFNNDLTIGSEGADVVALQSFLESKGTLVIPAGVSKGYFGQLTKSALASYQAMVGISPAAGYFGPITRANVNASAVVTTGTTTTTTTTSGLSGGEASLEDFDLKSETDVEEGEMAHVATIEFDVEDGDVEINRVDVSFVSDGIVPNEEDEPWDVFETITLMIDGEEVAEMDIDDEDDWLDDDEPFVVRLSGLDYVVDEGDSVEIEIYLTANSSVDGADVANAAKWDLAIAEDGIRAVDSKGIQNYIGSDTLVYAVNGYTAGEFVTFDVEVAGEGEEISMQISSDDPEESTLQVDNDDDSDWYDIFVFDLEAEETDIDLENVEIDIATVGNNYEDIISDVKLTIDGEEFDVDTTTNPGSLLASLTFDIDGDVTIDADDTVEAVLSVEFRDTNNQLRYQNGDTVQATATLVEGEGDDYVVDTNDVVGETHTLVAEGLSEDFTSKDSEAVTLGDDTIAKFTFEFEVEAFEDTFYISEDAEHATNGFNITLDGGTLISATIVSTDADLNGAGTSYRIAEGDTNYFEIEVQVESALAAGTAESVRVTIDSLDYDTQSDLAGTDANLDLGAPDYRSGSVTVIDAA